MERLEILNTKKISFHRLNRNLFVLIIILAVSYFVLQIFVTSLVGTKSEEVDSVRQEKAQLRLENEILTSKIDQQKSLGTDTVNLETKANNLQEKGVLFLQEPNLNDVALKK